MRPTADARADLMRGWDDWIGFARANTVVQLMLDGVAQRDLDKVKSLLKGALVAALLGPAGST